MSMTAILQFGTSRFLQAHADLFVSEALETGDAIGAITVVQSSGDPARRARLQALAAPEGFPVRIEGMVDGRPVRRQTRVTSVSKALSSETDWPLVTELAVEEARIILSNTGDSGWTPHPSDAGAIFDQAMSYPAKLTQLLLARYRAGRAGLTVMPTELVSRNGDTLAARVLALAEPIDGAFASWVRREIVFANSLVDRIVSEPLEPAGAVAEPYALWAIENAPGLVIPCRHAAIELVNDLAPFERRKLFILNLGHTFLAQRWRETDGEARDPDALVREAIANPAARAELESLYAEEVVPVFAAAGREDEAKAYVATTLDRFANPFLNHRLADIAQNHREKIERRFVALLAWSAELGSPVLQPRLRRIADG